MGLKFTKMHGLGNDFIVIDAINQTFSLSTNDIKSLADRHLGIGFDQCLLVEKSNQPGVDFFYRIFNANGQEVGQCGNGARCLGLFIKDKGLSNKTHLIVATSTTQMAITLGANDWVSVKMNKPVFKPSEIPFKVSERQETYECITNSGRALNLHALSVGNPHAVIKVDDIEQAPVSTIGKEISEHDLFPQQTNVSFMQVQNSQEIKLRVYERGTGETMACGSAAAASAVVGRLFYGLDNPVKVGLLGGELEVSYEKEQLILSGPASFVFDGEIR